MLERFDFDDVEQCIRLAKVAIDANAFDEIAEGVYRGLSITEGALDRFLDAVGPYYFEAQERKK